MNKRIIIGAALAALSTLCYPTTEHKSHKKADHTKKNKHSSSKEHQAKSKKHAIHHQHEKTAPTHAVSAHKKHEKTTATQPSMVESASSKLHQWLGLGTAAKATTAAGLMKNSSGQPVHHIGPREWHHRFPGWWENRGWVGQEVSGTWYFAGYPLEWWQKHYPAYYKDVVHPEYTAYVRK